MFLVGGPVDVMAAQPAVAYPELNVYAGTGWQRWCPARVLVAQFIRQINILA
jgi:hypothetical protein